MIKNLALFRKLYPVAAPVPEHFPYYLDRLHLALRCSPPLDEPWLDQALADFVDLESTRPDPEAYVGAWRNRLATQISSWSWPSWEPKHKPFNPKLELVEQHANRRLVRVDLVSANYAAVRAMCQGTPPDTWEDMCRELGVHHALARSKAFRQSVLGLCDPRKQQAYQSDVTDVLAELIGSHPAMPMVRRSPDELVYDVEDMRRHYPSILPHTSLLKQTCKLECRVEWFDLVPLGFMRGFLWRSFASSTAEHPVSVRPFAVPGNRYYLALTRAVLREKVVDCRDTLYFDDGEHAQWSPVSTARRAGTRRYLICPEDDY